MTKYAIYRKGDYKPIIVLDDFKQAQDIIKNREMYCEIRRVIEDDYETKN